MSPCCILTNVQFEVDLTCTKSAEGVINCVMDSLLTFYQTLHVHFCTSLKIDLENKIWDFCFVLVIFDGVIMDGHPILWVVDASVEITGYSFKGTQSYLKIEVSFVFRASSLKKSKFEISAKLVRPYEKHWDTKSWRRREIGRVKRKGRERNKAKQGAELGKQVTEVGNSPFAPFCSPGW